MPIQSVYEDPESPGLVYDSQQELLTDISALHNKGLPFEVDLTFGDGGFWKGDGLPTVRMDLDPRWKPVKGNPGDEITQCNLVADLRALPFAPASLRSAVLDPPYIHAAGKDSIIGKRFGSLKSQKDLGVLYTESMNELRRVMAPKGLLVVKTQDIVESGKQVWNHILFYNLACLLGFEVEDLLISARRHAVTGHNHSHQQHARKVHCFWWVFRRRKDG